MQYRKLKQKTAHYKENVLSFRLSPNLFYYIFIEIYGKTREDKNLKIWCPYSKYSR